MLTVGELRKKLEGVPDDVRVLHPGSDHSYRETQAIDTTALYVGGHQWTEDHGRIPGRDFGKRLRVIVIE